jgi:Tfp pilus assembly major pilin PilA
MAMVLTKKYPKAIRCKIPIVNLVNNDRYVLISLVHTHNSQSCQIVRRKMSSLQKKTQ